MGKKTKSQTVGIIGAGIGGMATAIRLSLKGYNVSVYESALNFGGKLNELQENGFRFDKGPSLFTLPGLLDDLFRKAHKNPRNYFSYLRLDPITRYFFADGTQFTVPAKAEDFSKNASDFFGVPQINIDQYLKTAEYQFETTKGPFLDSPINSPLSVVRFENIPLFFQLNKLGIFKNLHDENKKKLKEKRLVQMFDRYATYSGSSPYEASAILSQTAHLEHHVGAFLPVGGMYSIAKALYRLALELGVDFHFDAKVDKVVTHLNKVKGLRVNEMTFNHQIVVCNADNHYAYRHLLSGTDHAHDEFNKEPKSSAPLVFYWGVKGNYPQLDVHNILFSDDYKKEFDEIFNQNQPPKDPTIYINITSKIVKSDAPEGHENWFVMINVPPRDHEDNWFSKREQMRSIILQKIKERLGIDVLENLVYESHLDPYTLEKINRAYRGSIYGNRSVGPWSVFKRQPNKTKVEGLYFVGGTVHPGGGIPLVLSSAKVTANLISGQ